MLDEGKRGTSSLDLQTLGPNHDINNVNTSQGILVCPVLKFYQN